MAWIELHQEFRDHPKVARLAARLNVDYCLAEAYLINLWLWACSYARNGDLSKFSRPEITEAAKSKVEPSLFVEVLVETRWIDKKGEKVTLHDWKQYGLRILDASKRRTAKFRRENKIQDKSVTTPRHDSTKQFALLSILSFLSIPSNHILHTPQFSATWDEWLEYRKQKRKPLTELSARQQVRFLSKQPDPIACVTESIRNDWQGIFELKSNKYSPPQKQSVRRSTWTCPDCGLQDKISGHKCKPMDAKATELMRDLTNKLSLTNQGAG